MAEQTKQVQVWLGLLKEGDRVARDELIRYACGKLRGQAQKMLDDFRRLRRFEQTDDVLQSALMRLQRALEEVEVESPQHFLRLATTMIRRELLDLTRHHFGPEGTGPNVHPDGLGESSTETGVSAGFQGEQTTYEPGQLANWSEFHRLVDELPQEEKVVFELLWYQELTQPEAASVLGMTLATVRRRYGAARLRLQRLLGDQSALLDEGA